MSTTFYTANKDTLELMVVAGYTAKDGRMCCENFWLRQADPEYFQPPRVQACIKSISNLARHRKLKSDDWILDNREILTKFYFDEMGQDQLKQLHELSRSEELREEIELLFLSSGSEVSTCRVG